MLGVRNNVFVCRFRYTGWTNFTGPIGEVITYPTNIVLLLQWTMVDQDIS
jgi:hypothetical protein